ncbi:hypothetical protein Ocin01_10042 [Orchesella cincta]|uniref:Uncharacterized protein n=1 Tax=Orchesella cincta TaxID=48709 RepID=A0A1D2MU56_ORCCI|nr:hypothetical protein Ocin01_10042 [Orchesella cincta]
MTAEQVRMELLQSQVCLVLVPTKEFKIAEMILILFLVHLIAQASTSSVGIRSIEITQPGEGTSGSNLPVVHGIRSCGGNGQVLEWRFEPCTATENDELCKIPGDDNLKRPGEIDFIPSRDISSLGLRLTLESDGEAKTVFEKALSNSSVQAGERYTMHATGGAKRDLKGKTVTIQFILFNVDGGDVEVCSEADFLVI